MAIEQFTFKSSFEKTSVRDNFKESNNPVIGNQIGGAVKVFITGCLRTILTKKVLIRVIAACNLKSNLIIVEFLNNQCCIAIQKRMTPRGDEVVVFK